MKNTKKGFTLVELLVVIAILAILASVAVVGYTAFLKDARESKANTEAHQIETAIEASLMVNDYVVVGTIVTTTTEKDAEGNDVTIETTTYIVVDENKTVTGEADPEALEGKVDDISENFKGFALSIEDGKLIYTSEDNIKVALLAD